MENPLEFDSLLDLFDRIPDDKAATEYFALVRWDGEPECPHCESKQVYKRSGRTSYKCGSCRKEFTVKSKTVFADSKVGMRKWLIAVYLMISNKKGLSSCDLSRKVKITQKTAWYMIQRIQHAFDIGGFETPAYGVVELDETYVGGKEKNKHQAVIK